MSALKPLTGEQLQLFTQAMAAPILRRLSWEPWLEGSRTSRNLRAFRMRHYLGTPKAVFSPYERSSATAQQTPGSSAPPGTAVLLPARDQGYGPRSIPPNPREPAGTATAPQPPTNTTRPQGHPQITGAPHGTLAPVLLQAVRGIQRN